MLYIASRTSCPTLPVPSSSLGQVCNSGTSQTGQISCKASSEANVAFFFSDDSVDTNPTAVPNGTTVTDIGADTSNGGSISATFNDNGDVARAPDAGSTVGLLFLALTALFSASRLRLFQLG